MGFRTGTPPYDPLAFLSGQCRQVQTATSARAPNPAPAALRTIAP